MNNKISKPIYEKVNTVLEVIAIVCIIMVCLYCYVAADVTDIKFKFEQPASWNEGWLLDGEVVTVPFSKRVKKGESVTFRNSLPEIIPDNMVLYFASKNGMVQVYVDNELIYSYGEKTHLAFGNIRGEAVNLIPIKSEYAGSDINIVYTRGYNGKFGVDDIILCNKDKAIIRLFTHEMWRIVLMILFAGVALLSFWLVFFKSKINVQTPGVFIFYFACINANLSAWIFLESSIYQFVFTKVDSPIFLRYMILISIPIFYIGCAKYIFPTKWDSLSKIQICGIMLCGLVTALYVTSIADPEQLRGLLHTYILICAVYTCIVSLKFIDKNEYAKYMFIDIVVLTVFCLAALYISRVHPESEWDAKFLCYGYILFCFGLIYIIEKMNINNTNEILADEIYAEMAFKDSLTFIGNRAAFERDLLELENDEYRQEIITCIMCDLNYLKQVNDTLGHEKGDELIIIAAKIIENAVSEFGKTYRIGGDEFCVICHGNEDYSETVINRIQCGIKNHNNECELMVSTAIGMANREVGSSRNLKEVFKEADDNMYEDKKNYHK